MDKEILKSGLLREGFKITEKQENDFFKYSSLLVEWNKKMNLTAITDPKEISIKHFLDSVVPVLNIKIPKNSKVIDVGTGAGFPGFPIKILRKDLNFTFLDSLNKRINFLKTVSDELCFEKAEFVHARAEEAGKNDSFREKYDFAVSRAVAPLKILSEYCIPFLKVGGKFLAFKSFEIEEELEESKKIIKELGAKIIEIKEFVLFETDIKRKIIIIEKLKKTPSLYPRHSNKIKGC